MKILVIQEQHFVRMPNGEVWVDEQSNSKFWERYLSVFDEVVVCARFRHADAYITDDLMLSDHENVFFVELPNTRGVVPLAKNYLKIRKNMKNAMKDCDCILFRAPSPISIVAYPLAKKSGKPYAAEIVNNPATCYSSTAIRNFLAIFIQKLTVRHIKSLCQTANGISYVTEKTLQELYPSTARLKGESNRYFESSYSTIHIEKSQYSFDKWPDKRPEKITFIHTGKMQDNRKGQDIFIQIISNLRKKGYNVEGILVGDGIMRPDFERLGQELGITDYLDFVGWKAGFEAVQKQLKRAQIAIFPSMGEGLPRSVIEAMAQGVLCFGSKIDGICELLEGDCLVPEINAECFTLHIQKYLDNWSIVLNERKRQYDVSKKYEFSILQERREDFYKKLREVK